MGSNPTATATASYETSDAQVTKTHVQVPAGTAFFVKFLGHSSALETRSTTDNDFFISLLFLFLNSGLGFPSEHGQC